MPTAEEVVVEFEARIDKYQADLKRSTVSFQNATKQQETAIKHLERQIAASSGQIGSHLKGLAGTFAAAFSGRQIMGLVDSFTRYQNQLKVAGFEGQRLADVQTRLSDIANRYGVSLESTGTLFGRNAASAKQLNLSLEDQFRIVEATSAALKVNGTSSQEAAGALLQLSQVLGGTKVQAEEYNSLIDGARPLLQAVADGSDRWGGSVAKLTQDVKAGTVATDEFAHALLKGSVGVVKQAESATLTLAGAFTVMRNKLVEYVGGASSASGATGGMADAIKQLADNLDTIIPAITVIIGALGIRYVGSAAAATVSTIALGAAATGTAAQMGVMGAATFALQARMAGAATTTEAFAFALNGMKGGLVTAAVIAFGAAIYYVKTQTIDAREATGVYAKAQHEAEDITKKAATAAERLANAHGKARVEALAAARAEAEYIKQKLASARASVALAQVELARARAKAIDLQAGAQASLDDSGAAMTGALYVGNSSTNQAKSNIDSLNASIASMEKSLKTVTDAIAGVGTPKVSPVGGGFGKTPKGSKSDGGGPSGPTEKEIANRFDADRAALAQQALSAMAAIISAADERAELELRGVEIARIRNLADIRTNSVYFDAKKKEFTARGEVLRTQVEGLAEAQRAQVEFERQRQIREESLAAAESMLDNNIELLHSEQGTAVTQKERRRIALDILDAEYEKLKLSLEGAIKEGEINGVSEDTLKAMRDRLANLKTLKKGATKGVEEETAGPMESYLDGLQKTADDLDTSLENVAVGGLQTLSDGIADAIVNFKSLGDVARAVVQSMLSDIAKLIVKMLILKAIKAIFGLSEGGSVGEGKASGGVIGYAGGGRIGYPTGGLIVGPGTGTSDSVPAITMSGRPIRVSDGEYVIRESSVRKIGVNNLHRMNATGEMPVLPNGQMVRSGGGSSGLSLGFHRDLKSTIAEAVRTMPPINLYPTLDPATVIRSALSTPGGRKAMFDFVGANSGQFSSSLRR